jgi:pimeloyl-ACP methyl ester carboxylesterase
MRGTLVDPMRRIILPTLLALLLAGASSPARAASDCANFFGPRCRIELPTGVRMSYVETGAEQGDETLIFLHTDTTSALDWAWTVAALLERHPEYRVFALDLRGAHGTSLPNTERCRDKPNLCMTQAELASDVLDFMEDKGIERAVLVGHAWGAGIARHIALHHPERVAKLILVGAGAPVQGGAPPPEAGALAAFRDQAFAPLGWQKMLEARGVKWPDDVLHMRPIDIDPGAVDNIARNWDISAVAKPEIVSLIAAQTATEPLGTWGYGLDPTPRPPTQPENFQRLQAPTLALWASADAGFKAAQGKLIDALRLAAKKNKGMYFYWKQYGVRPPPASGDKHEADEIGHDIPWEAPVELAADIASFVDTGKPTPDLYRTDAPADIHRIVTEPGKAVIVSSVTEPTKAAVR